MGGSLMTSQQRKVRTQLPLALVPKSRNTHQEHNVRVMRPMQPSAPHKAPTAQAVRGRRGLVEIQVVRRAGGRGRNQTLVPTVSAQARAEAQGILFKLHLEVFLGSFTL